MTTAYWCVLAAAVLPFLFTAIAKFSGPGFNNRKPRDFQAELQGFRRRAHWAHLNSFEAFPPFAAAVIIAHQLHAQQSSIDALALAFVALRVIYGAFYIADLATARSLAWVGSLACVVGLFIIAA